MKNGDQKCKRCKGKGKVDWTTTDIVLSNSKEVKCPDCKGKGKVDWITYIKGPKNVSYMKAFHRWMEDI